MYELLNDIRPTYVLHLPQGELESSIDEWTNKIRRFKEYIESTFGITITDEALRTAARLRNEERAARLTLMELQKSKPPTAHGRLTPQLNAY